MKIPSKRTLAKYGMNELHYAVLEGKQGGLCGVCDERLDKGRTYIDHEHRKGWSKMTPEQKRRQVRGILHFHCNRYLVAKNTADTIDMVHMYLLQKRPLA